MGIYIKKIDRIGTETILGGSATSHSLQLLANNENYVALPFRFEIKEAEVAPQEKLIVYVR